MALGTIEELVRVELPYLANDIPTNNNIGVFKTNRYYFMQSYYLTPDVSVEDDSYYTGNKRILVALLVAYDMLNKKAIENSGGSSASGTGSGSGNRVVKKATADVVEAEFETTKASDGVTIQLDTKTILGELQKRICSLAYSMKIRLDICGCKKLQPPPFIFYPNTNID